MAVSITHTEDLDDFIHIYVPTTDLPDTYYVNQQYRDCLRMGYEDNIISIIDFVRKERELPISFDAEHYIDLAEHLKEHLSYSLSQARIISWIESVRNTSRVAITDWGNVYLENAYGC